MVTKTKAPKAAKVPKTPKAAAVVPAGEDSAAKAAFRVVMENYKVSNPEKYAAKEAGFLKKLNTL